MYHLYRLSSISLSISILMIESGIKKCFKIEFTEIDTFAVSSAMSVSTLPRADKWC